jgi:hypothetical protein
LELVDDRLDDPVQLDQDLDVRESQDPDPFAREQQTSGLIAPWPAADVVRVPVHLDSDSPLHAVEVEHVVPYLVLPPELEPMELFASQAAPQDTLGRSGCRAPCATERHLLFSVHAWLSAAALGGFPH